MASTDSLSDVTAFAEKNMANFPILADPTKNNSERLRGAVTDGFAKRWTFYIDDTGTVIHMRQISQPRTAGPDLAANLKRLNL